MNVFSFYIYPKHFFKKRHTKSIYIFILYIHILYICIYYIYIFHIHYVYVSLFFFWWLENNDIYICLFLLFKSKILVSVFWLDILIVVMKDLQRHEWLFFLSAGAKAETNFELSRRSRSVWWKGALHVRSS